MGVASQQGHVASSPPPLVHALSGAVGAVVAMALLYPLDQVRAILQVDDDLARECAAPGGAGVAGALSRIVRRHGRAGLWRGMVPVLITMGVSNFVYFYCFSGMKAALLARRRLLLARSARAVPATLAVAAAATVATSSARVVATTVVGGAGGGVEGLTPLESVIASTIAGVVNVLATTPLWVSNLRIKAGNGVGGLFSTLASIGSNEGLGGLWSGAAPSLVLVSNPIIQFVVYETLKQAAGNRHSRKMASQGLTCPGGVGGVGGGGGVDGGGGGGGSGSRQAVGLPSHEVFLLGATAKAVSTLITYPLQLAQAKLRAGNAQGQGQSLRQGHCRRSGPSSTLEGEAEGGGGGGGGGAGGGWRASVLWQLLTCWSSTADILVSVCRDNGVGGMYQGMRAKLLHTVLTSALMFLGYEKLAQVIATAMAQARASSAPSSTGEARGGGARHSVGVCQQQK